MLYCLKSHIISKNEDVEIFYDMIIGHFLRYQHNLFLFDEIKRDT